MLAAGLVIVNVSVVVPPTATDPAKALLIVGGATTVRLATLLGAPAPLCVEETVPVVFDRVPAAVPVTLTLNVQLLLIANVPPVSKTVPAAATGVPAQVFVRLGVDATVKPVGNVSLKAKPVRASVFAAGFVIVKVSVVDAFSGTLDAVNALLIVGAAAAIRVAVLLTVPVPPFVELTVPVVSGKLPA